MKKCILRHMAGMSIAACVLFASDWCCAGDLVLTNLTSTIEISFAGFEGTFDTLPDGIGVSSDGMKLLTALNAGDFLGVSTGFVLSGGCYAWDLDGTNRALGCQPTSDEFSPGYFVLMLSNASPCRVSGIALSFDVVCRNNGNRSSVITMEAGIDNRRNILIPDASVVTPEVAGTNAVWERVSRTMTVLLPASCMPGRRLWIRWRGDDVRGSGYRDEYGIADVRVRFLSNSGTLVTLR